MAAELYSQTLSALVAARSAMMSSTWITAQQQQSDATRLQASLQLIRTQQAIAALSNAQLTNIANQMHAIEGALHTAVTNLNQCLTDLTHVQDVLNQVSTLVDTVAKIVPLV
jgi:hypothetical protein